MINAEDLRRGWKPRPFKDYCEISLVPKNPDSAILEDEVGYFPTATCG